MIAKACCLQLLVQEIWRAFSLALLRAGSNMAARMAMMAMTTKSSMRVKCRRKRRVMVFSFNIFSFNELKMSERDKAAEAKMALYLLSQ
jgi:hypothetical protein